MPDGEGKIHLVKLFDDGSNVEPRFDAQKDVIFNLYTRFVTLLHFFIYNNFNMSMS